MGRFGLVGIAIAAMCAVVAADATATSLMVCVPEKEGAAIVTPKGGLCKAKYTASTLLPAAEAEKLEKLLPHMSYVESGVGGKPTVQFSGVNVQVVNGEGRSGVENGEGNVVIGYDENPGKHAQTGSHNLVLGEEQTFTSIAGIISGAYNTISGAGAISLGLENTASGSFSSVLGGRKNSASGFWASIGGGEANVADGGNTSVSGGAHNTADGSYSEISGGESNTTKLSARYSAILGGKLVETTTEFEHQP